MTTGPTFQDCCPQRRSEPEWPDVEKMIEKIAKRRRSDEGYVELLPSEWRQIKSLLERLPSTNSE